MESRSLYLTKNVRMGIKRDEGTKRALGSREIGWEDAKTVKKREEH